MDDGTPRATNHRQSNRRERAYASMLSVLIKNVRTPASFYYLVGADVLETRCERTPSGAGRLRARESNAS
jgi:hypothetical protein